MPVRIDDYILDYKLGSTGIVYFKTSDGATRQTPPLSPELFCAVAAVLLRPASYDASGIFRNIPQRTFTLMHEKRQEFTEEELNNKEKFETWELITEH